MSREQPDKVVLVCRWRGHTDRFFGKYKSFEDGQWVKIPGGAFPPAFDTTEKAMMLAKQWYEDAKAEHGTKLAAVKPPRETTWDEVCDAYIVEIQARMRGKPSTRHEAITVTNASIRKGVLATVKPSEIDENHCLRWLRSIARENIASEGKPPRFRKPMTVRNIAKHLRYLFKAVIRLKLVPGLTVNPTQGDEFRDELKALVAKAEPREWLLPVESFAKLVACPQVPAHRRIMYLALGLTGLRPGELAGLQVRHIQREGDVRFLAVEQQFTFTRSKGDKGRIDTPKTKWARRSVPLHPALQGPLDAWLKEGWSAFVGREPKAEDFVFPDWDGRPRRPHDADLFRKDLVAAGCPTFFNGEPLTPYSLRHMFSTLLTESHAHDAAHDRMMGHRPKDTKTLNYSAKLLPFLATEIAKLAFVLPADAPSFGSAATAAETAPSKAGSEGERQ